MKHLKYHTYKLLEQGAGKPGNVVAYTDLHGLAMLWQNSMPNRGYEMITTNVPLCESMAEVQMEIDKQTLKSAFAKLSNAEADILRKHFYRVEE
jgi:hypothetical protein